MRELMRWVALGLVVGCGAKEEGAGADDGDDIGDAGGVGGGGSGGDGGGSDGADGADGGDGSDGADGGDDGAVDDGGDWGDGGDGIDPEPADIVPEDVPCGDDLSFQATAADPWGACDSACDGATIWFAALVYNPCSTAMSVTVDGGWLISSVSASNDETGEGFGSAGGSDGTLTTFEVAPGEWIVQTETIGALDPGPWRAELVFGDTDRHTVPFSFTVVE